MELKLFSVEMNEADARKFELHHYGIETQLTRLAFGLASAFELHHYGIETSIRVQS